MSHYVLSVDDAGHFRDGKNRVITLRGINLDGASKLPVKPHITTYTPVDENDESDPFWDGDNVSFVGRPFALEEADEHFVRIRSWGYNLIRYVYSWEALEHKGPGLYDDDFVEYSIKVLKKMSHYGFYVILDPHQDVWGRFSGGSGAPLWTYYAAGLDPKGFRATTASLVQNLWPGGPENCPKMFWATNYYRHTCQLMFTLFFAGKVFAPMCIINGKNIQDFLQDHMLAAIMHFYKRIADTTDLFETCIFSAESMNEPNLGLITVSDIGIIPKEQNLRLGTCPTAFQSMLLASGHKQTVDYYTFSSLGPRKKGTETVDPEGTTVWLSSKKFDDKYGFNRDPKWKLGECIWALHGVWDSESLELLLPDYFAFDGERKEIDEEYFVNVYFVEYWQKFYTAHRQFRKDLYLLCQPPVLAVPPKLKGTKYVDDHVVYAPHYYDGITLMLKRWSTVWNVDTLGYLRGKYSSPVFAIKLGEQTIRKCLREQINLIRTEGLENMGAIPCLMSETGIPFDMDDKKSYTTGDYTSQTRALDAMAQAIESANIGVAFWGYTSTNTQEHGDYWNGEDFSFWSRGAEHKEGDSEYSETDVSSYTSHDQLYVHQFKDGVDAAGGDPVPELNIGIRAIAAVLRPFPAAVRGSVSRYEFDLDKATFELEIDAEDTLDIPANDTTEIFVPVYHFPRTGCAIEVSSGSYDYDSQKQVLYWWHGPGEQNLTIKALAEDEEVDASDCACPIM